MEKIASSLKKMINIMLLMILMVVYSNGSYFVIMYK